MSEEKVFRPIKVSKIKNKSLRRASMIALFFPLIILAYLVLIVRGAYWLIEGFINIPVSLFKSGKDFWNESSDS